jgi:hypothetical protein
MYIACGSRKGLLKTGLSRNLPFVSVSSVMPTFHCLCILVRKFMLINSVKYLMKKVKLFLVVRR